MAKHLLFIQGGGDEGYQADTTLVASLQELLGNEYDVNYPELTSNESASDFGWIEQIGRKISEAPGDVILAGHSLGASMLLKYLSENPVSKTIKGVFLIATPFWEGHEDWKAGLKLQENVADRLPKGIPFFFYHCQDDDEVPFSHLALYQQNLPQATFRELNRGGHQLDNALNAVAADMKSL
ncbi:MULTISPECIES: alpha/beta hydrolase [Spirosoma]|uniref:Alpha/beta hydrolase n=1 Tax=Spirosoma sordidisoli TaxID=2502893 RepID=A0A4Q2UKK5_9BACT|nr:MULTISPECIES: alpha/beta hydrolase [Spirosoma]RYC68161.1 hypothetical protein EQG79_22185 [Spirosoma sordidisoli]